MRLAYAALPLCLLSSLAGAPARAEGPREGEAPAEAWEERAERREEEEAPPPPPWEAEPSAQDRSERPPALDYPEWPPEREERLEGELDRDLDRQLRLEYGSSRPFRPSRARPERAPAWPKMPEDPLPPAQLELRPPSRAQGSRPFMDYDNPGVVRLEAFYLPLVGLFADRDENERDEGLLFPKKIHSGQGFGARLGFGPDYCNLGLLYLASQHEEYRTGVLIDAHVLLADLLLGGALNEGPLEFTLYAGIGLGGAIFDFHDTYHDTGGAVLGLRCQTGLRILEHLELNAGAGWMIWGYPGETVGRVGYLSLGLTLRF